MQTTDKKQLYLVTGFLGSGKTTLMKRLIAAFSDRKIAVVVNEFGSQGVDGDLLSQEGVRVDEISNGSIFCVCRSDLFVDALVRALKTDADTVLVETSGLSDPTGMDKILAVVEQVSRDGYDFCGTIALADATRFLKLFKTAVAVKQQVLSAGLVLINKTDLADAAKIVEIRETVAKINPAAIVRETAYAAIDPRWLDELRENKISTEGIISINPIGTQKFLVEIPAGTSESALREWLLSFLPDAYRVKGFVELDTGWSFIDAAGDLSMTRCEPREKSAIVILASGTTPIKPAITDGWKKCFGSEILLIK